MQTFNFLLFVVSAEQSNVLIEPGTRGFFMAQSSDEVKRALYFCRSCHANVADVHQIRQCFCAESAVLTSGRLAQLRALARTASLRTTRSQFGQSTKPDVAATAISNTVNNSSHDDNNSHGNTVEVRSVGGGGNLSSCLESPTMSAPRVSGVSGSATDTLLRSRTIHGNRPGLFDGTGVAMATRRTGSPSRPLLRGSSSQLLAGQPSLGHLQRGHSQAHLSAAPTPPSGHYYHPHPPHHHHNHHQQQQQQHHPFHPQPPQALFAGHVSHRLDTTAGLG
ncbi:unnamed protein product, partial [Protopolystoma xenopodis]